MSASGEPSTSAFRRAARIVRRAAAGAVKPLVRPWAQRIRAYFWQGAPAAPPPGGGSVDADVAERLRAIEDLLLAQWKAGGALPGGPGPADLDAGAESGREDARK